jgi:hypothetical protein
MIMKRIFSKHQQNVLRKLEMPDNTFKITLFQKFSRIKNTIYWVPPFFSVEAKIKPLEK